MAVADAHMGLHQRLSTKLESTLGSATVWTAARECPQAVGTLCFLCVDGAGVIEAWTPDVATSER